MYNRRRRHHRNPTVGGFIDRTKTIAKSTPKLLPHLAVAAIAAGVNAKAASFVAKWSPLPMWGNGIITGILLTAGTGSLGATRRFAPAVLFGSFFEMVSGAMSKYVFPNIPGLKGLGDYLTVQDAANARPLGYFGDYLTVQDAQNARPLGRFGGMGNMHDTFVSEELAAL